MQTAEYAARMRATTAGVRMSVWDAFDLISGFVDTSFGGPSTSPIHHAFQTAETLRCTGAADWLVVVGLIHDLGVVLSVLRPDDGTAPDSQWALTGETEVLAGPARPARPAPTAPTGLDACVVSFGHAEYLYQVLRRSPGVCLPELAFRVVRYHELAAFRDGRLLELEDAADRHARPVMRAFAAADNHRRPVVAISAASVAKLRDRYAALVETWLPEELRW
jgi:hypothetical protein